MRFIPEDIESLAYHQHFMADEKIENGVRGQGEVTFSQRGLVFQLFHHFGSPGHEEVISS